eukprot:3176006-Rhodomonas_salina.1
MAGMKVLLSQRVMLPEAREAMLGVVRLRDQQGLQGMATWVAVATRANSLSLFNLVSRSNPQAFFFDVPPVAVCQNAALAESGEFFTLTEDGSLWRCKTGSLPQRAAKKAKPSKTNTDSQNQNFFVEGDRKLPQRQAARETTFFSATRVGARQLCMDEASRLFVV